MYPTHSSSVPKRAQICPCVCTHVVVLLVDRLRLPPKAGSHGETLVSECPFSLSQAEYQLQESYFDPLVKKEQMEEKMKAIREMKCRAVTCKKVHSRILHLLSSDLYQSKPSMRCIFSVRSRQSKPLLFP